MEIVLAIVLGGLFGFALYYVGTSSANILSMLRLQDLGLMKIIMFAIGFSSVMLFFANLFGIFNVGHLSIKSTNAGVIIGGLIFGIGFGIVGACPGTCIAQAGGGALKKSLYTIIGGIIGAFAFSMSYGWFSEMGLFGAMDFGKLTLFDISGKYPSLINIGFYGLLIAGIIFMLIAILLPMNTKWFKQSAA